MKLVLLFLALMAARAANASEAEALAERMLAALGGRTAWATRAIP